MIELRKCYLYLLMLLMLAGCAINPVTGRNELALMDIPVEEEIKMGQQAYGQALQTMGSTYPDKALTAYIDKVGQRVAARSHRPELKYSFSVVNDSSPNAFALPGGFIAISRGLLINLENEAQLAAVLGHEVAHVTARHSVQGMQRGSLLGATVSILGGIAGGYGYGDLATQLGGVTANLIDKSYSREQESESDRIGIDYMVLSGYAPQGAIELQEIFYRKIEGGANPDWLGGMFRSHPFSKDRLDANRDYVQSTYAGTKSNYGLEKSSYRRAIAPLLKTQEAYALYDQARQLEAKQQLDTAIETYHKAMQLAPDQGLLLSGVGMAYLRKDDLIPARRYLIKAVQVDDGYFMSQMGLGYIYLKNEDAQKAAPHLESSLKLMPTLQSAFLLAEAEESLGNLGKARELYQAVAKSDPRSKLGQVAAARLQKLGQ
ncbi:MAG TPA: M48 family metalloprotease [Malonomonas sp.]